MTLTQVMTQLKTLGTAQNVKVYKRHGAGGNLFGVSFANLDKLKKTIKTDHPLALQLWATGNADARCLAIMIADADAMKPSEANAWLADISYYLHADLLSGLIARTKFAASKMAQWMKSKKEFHRQCGYDILASRLRNGDPITDAECKTYLRTIEKEIHGSANRARHAMNMALIAIGIYRPNLTDLAIAAAERIGKVEVDHGETSCKTPAAIPYIQKAIKRRK